MNITDKTYDDRWVFTLKMARPELSDNTSDAERIAVALKKKTGAEKISFSLDLIRKIPAIVRKSMYHVKCVVFRNGSNIELVSVIPAEDRSVIAGLAVDLGTTRIVVRLIDIEHGTAMCETSMDNPQISVGPDVLTRIHFAEKENGLSELQLMLVNGINALIKKTAADSGIKPEDVHLMTVAGNTVMTHFFLGVEPRYIIREPYIPAINRPGLFRSSELGIMMYENGRVFVFPNIGSYFGGDIIAGIICSGLHKEPELSILVDVGTNAEVVLGNSDFLVACAGAAGPALESGVSSFGMMAGPGAIDRVKSHSDGTLEIHTIDDLKPVGICGSGFIDLAAALFTAGLIDIRGRIVSDHKKGHVKNIDGMNHLVIVPEEHSGTGEDIVISQASLDSLIRSKAAMYTILETIALNVGVSLFDLSKFYVAGTFGSYIDPRSAITIGMMPDLSIDVYRTLGNSSLEGAVKLLENRYLYDDIDVIRDSVTYMELNVDQGFMNRFSGAKFLPHTNPDLFPSVKFS